MSAFVYGFLRLPEDVIAISVPNFISADSDPTAELLDLRRRVRNAALQHLRMRRELLRAEKRASQSPKWTVDGLIEMRNRPNSNWLHFAHAGMYPQWMYMFIAVNGRMPLYTCMDVTAHPVALALILAQLSCPYTPIALPECVWLARPVPEISTHIVGRNTVCLVCDDLDVSRMYTRLVTDLPTAATVLAQRRLASECCDKCSTDWYTMLAIWMQAVTMSYLAHAYYMRIVQSRGMAASDALAEINAEANVNKTHMIVRQVPISIVKLLVDKYADSAHPLVGVTLQVNALIASLASSSVDELKLAAPATRALLLALTHRCARALLTADQSSVLWTAAECKKYDMFPTQGRRVPGWRIVPHGWCHGTLLLPPGASRYDRLHQYMLVYGAFDLNTIYHVWRVVLDLPDWATEADTEDSAKGGVKDGTKAGAKVGTSANTIWVLARHLRICGACTRFLPHGGYCCARCRCEYYCGRACQRAGWPSHRAQCLPDMTLVD